MIEEWALDGGIDPYEPSQLNPALYDLRLGNEFVDLQTGLRFRVGDGEEFSIIPGTFLLATTVEYVKVPDNAAGVLYLKSTEARRGTDLALAGYCDPGFHGMLTLEIHAHRELKLKPNQRFVQLVLMSMYEQPRQVYQGRYQDQRGPTRAREPVRPNTSEEMKGGGCHRLSKVQPYDRAGGCASSLNYASKYMEGG